MCSRSKAQCVSSVLLLLTLVLMVVVCVTTVGVRDVGHIYGVVVTDTPLL